MSRPALKFKGLLFLAFVVVVFALPAQIAFAPFAHADPGVTSIDIDYIVDPTGDYYSSGTVYSKSLAAGLTVNSFDYFGYNATIPANTTIQIMFSQDNINWYSANHTLSTWTSLANGNSLTQGSDTNLNLSGFTPSYNFYYQVLLSTTDTSITPTLTSVQLYYNTGSYAAVSTSAATNVAGITATGNGNISSIGGSTVTERGFQYTVDSTYASYLEVSETGSFGTGDYPLALPNLQSSATYYYRSFVTNTQGRAYGSWQTFTTNAYYNTSGTLYSINLLAGQSVGGITSFYTSATVPSGTSITAMFSQDNTNWYNAAGTLNGTPTNIPNGTTTTSLSMSPAWSGANFYYKIVLNASSDYSATPTLTTVTVNYGPPDAYWVAGSGGNWSDAATHWACSSGGSASASCAPGTTTNVHFDSNSGTGTVTINSASVTVANFDESSTNITIDTSTNGITITGDTTINKTLQGATAVTFTGTGKTITGGSGGTISAPVVLSQTQIVAVATGTFTMSGIISDGGATKGISKTGANELDLSGANTYTGATTISAGTLALTNNLTLYGNVTVNSGGTLSAVTGGKTITFTSGITLQVNSGGTLTFHGSAGNLLNLPASTTSAWILAILSGATYSMDYVNPTYSDATTSYQTIANTNSTDGGHNPNWAFDLTPPTVSVTNPPTGAYNSQGWTNLAPAFSCADGGSGCDTSSCKYSYTTSTYGSMTSISCTGAIPAPSQGTNLTLYVAAKDLAGNTGTNSYTGFAYDTTNPTSTISSPSDNSYSTSTTVALSGTSADTNLSSTTISVDGGAPAAVTGTTSWTYSATGLSQGTHTFQTTATDTAGNTGTSSLIHVTVDSLAPSGYSVVIDQAYIDNSNKTAVSFTFSSAETGTTYNYSFTGISGPAVSSSGTIISSGQQITGIDLSGLGDGTVTLTAYLTDSTGNQGVDATNQKTKDVTAPTVTDNAPSGWQASNITTTLTCSDGTGTSGCSRVYYTTDNTTPSDSTSSYVDATSSWQFTTSTEGNYILKYRGKDAAGNLEGAITATNHIQLDKTAPTGQGIDFATPVSPTELDVTASVPTDGAGSGLASSPYWFREITGGTGSSSSTDWQDTTIFTDSGLTPNTLYAYEVKVKDALANTSDYSGSVTGYTLAAVPGTIALTASSSAQITATWSANENPSGTQYYIENYTNSTNSDWTADTSWQSSGLSCGTTYSFRVKARNTAGTETSWSDTASKTTPVCGGGGLPASVYTPPAPSAGTSFGILINNGAQSASVRYVVLTLTAGSNVSRMSISNDPNFTNAVQEPFSQTKLWTLTDGQGQKTVYVEFFTSYGVASGTVFATISYTLSVKEPIANFVPEIAPTALQGLKIMSINPLGNFAVAPVKSDVGFFAEKVPQFKKALDGLAINVNAPADIKKLTQTQLYLPGLAQTLSANSMQVNSLAGIQAIPLAQLSPAALDKIPSNVVFARTAGELIDFSSALAIDNKGNTEQRISTISGKPMELVIKPDAPASRVIGLITLKSLAKIDNNIGQNNPNNPLSFVAGFFTAALTSVNTVPIAPDSSQAGLLVQKFNYDETQPGVFKAEINAPTTEGEYQVTTVVQYKDTALTPTKTSLIAVVDPEGYVYQQLSGGKLRIQNATVSIFWLNPDTKKYELWPAEKFLQKNPVVTDDTGKYSFLVPQGTYYLTASALNYSSYKSDKFIIKEDNGVRIDIGLKKQAFLPDWFSWQAVIAVLLLIITILLCVFSVIYVKGRKK